MLDDPYFTMFRLETHLFYFNRSHTMDSLSILFATSQQLLSSICCSVISSTDSATYSEFVDQVRVAQQQDPVLGPLVQLRQQHDYNPATDRYRDLYVLLDDMLVVAELDRTRIVVPSGSIKQKLLKLYHDCSGHQGTTRTLWALEQGFFWPNMGREVKRYCASCPICQASNAARLRPPGFSQPHPIPSVPGAAWSVDFIELPATKTGLTCCCVWTDRLTKYAIICPLRMSRNDPLTARATAECFMQHVYLQFGCPLDITSDRGPQFV